MKLAYTIPAPAVILGLPLKESENPYLVAEIGKINAEFKVEDCREPRVIIEATPTGSIDEQVKRFAVRLVDELGLKICLKLRVNAPREIPIAGIYSALTAYLLRSVAKAHGEKLEIYEVIEYARLLDEVEVGWESWHRVLDALRYASLVGGIAVYRNDEEYAKLSNRGLRGVREAILIGREQLSDKETLGTDLYGALIHTMGVLVLEGAVRVRDYGEKANLNPLIRLHNQIAQFFWGLHAVENTLISPGLWPQFERIKLAD